MKLPGKFFTTSFLVLWLGVVTQIGVDSSAVPPTASSTNDCQTDDDCNIENAIYAPTRECKQGFKNMTTDCECLKEYYCRNGDGPCPLKCYPKKIDGCEHWGDNCISCKTAKGVNSCKNKEIEGECQEDGKCKYPDNKCRTNDDCQENQYCTWHDTYVSGSCDPGYYSPDDCPLGECKEYAAKCLRHTECGPGKFCTMANCFDDCPKGDCLPCDAADHKVEEFGGLPPICF